MNQNIQLPVALDAKLEAIETAIIALCQHGQLNNDIAQSLLLDHQHKRPELQQACERLAVRIQTGK